MNKDNKICLICKKEMPYYKNKYCSPECFHLSRIKIKKLNKCLVCGKETYNNKYCSPECVYASFKGKKHAEEWRRNAGLAHKGQIPWNKNLTKETDERVMKYTISRNETLKLVPRNKKIIPTRSCLICKTETINKKYCSRKCYYIAGNSLKGSIYSKETSLRGKRISEAHTGKPWSEKRILSQINYFKRANFISKPELMVKEIILSLNKVEDIDFIHQYHIKDIKHHYIADFFFPLLNKVIEEDGEWCHQGKKKERDEIRTSELLAAGFGVLRVTDQEVYKTHDNTKEKIKNFLENYNG